MQIETFQTLFSLTWEATKKVFSKPIIVILHLVMTTLLILGPDFIGLQPTFIGVCLRYLLFVLSLSLAYTFSIALLKAESIRDSEILSFWNLMINPSSFMTFIFDKSIFLKTFYFTLVKNLDVFLFVILSYLLDSIDQAVFAMLFIIGAGIIFLPLSLSLSLSLFNNICLIYKRQVNAYGSIWNYRSL